MTSEDPRTDGIAGATSKPDFACCECGGRFPASERRRVVMSADNGYAILAPLCPACKVKFEQERQE